MIGRGKSARNYDFVLGKTYERKINKKATNMNTPPIKSSDIAHLKLESNIINWLNKHKTEDLANYAKETSNPNFLLCLSYYNRNYSPLFKIAENKATTEDTLRGLAFRNLNVPPLLDLVFGHDNCSEQTKQDILDQIELNRKNRKPLVLHQVTYHSM